MPSNERKIIEQAKFAYSSLAEAFEERTKKTDWWFKVSRFYGKKDELKKNEGIFPQRFINDLVCVKLKKIVKLQDIIEKVI